MGILDINHFFTPTNSLTISHGNRWIEIINNFHKHLTIPSEFNLSGLCELRQGAKEERWQGKAALANIANNKWLMKMLLHEAEYIFIV
jgi:hypothetical protein